MNSAPYAMRKVPSGCLAENRTKYLLTVAKLQYKKRKDKRVMSYAVGGFVSKGELIISFVAKRGINRLADILSGVVRGALQKFRRQNSKKFYKVSM